jgi:hypothetical protein
MMSFKLYLFQCTVSIYPKYLFTASSPITEKVIPEAAMQNNYQQIQPKEWRAKFQH